MLDYFSNAAIFHSALAMFPILGANFAFTLVHILQEWKGEKVPLWRVFGAVIGLFVPNWLGFLSFTVALCLLQWLIGLIAITGWPGWPELPIWALGTTIGARLADSAVSHWLLYARGYRPNPGLSSTVLYVAEAIFLFVVFQKGLTAHPTAAWIGFGCGAGFFIVLVWAGLWLLRLLKPSWRHDKWVPGEPIPAWARE
ncbi:MAG: hypothetical protein WDO17_21105 [Alphaproteobacteria bacterium]